MALVSAATANFFRISVFIPAYSNSKSSKTLFETISFQVYDLASVYGKDDIISTNWHFSCKRTGNSVRLTSACHATIKFTRLSTFTDSNFAFNWREVTSSSFFAKLAILTRDTAFLFHTKSTWFTSLHFWILLAEFFNSHTSLTCFAFSNDGFAAEYLIINYDWWQSYWYFTVNHRAWWSTLHWIGAFSTWN